MGFKPDLDDQLVSFSALTLGLVIWPVKIVPEMTYNVSSVTLSLYTATNNAFVMYYVCACVSFFYLFSIITGLVGHQIFHTSREHVGVSEWRGLR